MCLDQKLGNELNLALEVPEQERIRTGELDVGYNAELNEWELIVKYSGSLDIIREAGYFVYELLGGYAIVYIPEERIEWLSALPQIVYVEKPKQIYFEVSEGRYAACISTVSSPPLSLNGEGTIVAVIDSGVDYAHPDFCTDENTTRLLEIWDQTTDTIYSSEQINEALRAGTRAERLGIVPVTDNTGHGTHVLGIAGGNGRASNGRNQGVASKSELLVVKMGGQSATSFPRTTELMRGVDYCIRKGIEYNRPIAINISFGNSYGSHDGGSLLETYLDNAAGIGRTTLVVATGNEGAKNRHTAGTLQSGESRLIEFTVGERTANLSIQLWKSYSDSFRITLISPSGSQTVLTEESMGVYREQKDNTVLYWLFGEPSPYQVEQEIYLEMLPSDEMNYIAPGVWKIVLEGVQVVVGRYRMWMPAGSNTGSDTGFLIPYETMTLTIPSTADNVISVGAYDSRTDSLAAFSGRGPTGLGLIKPDLVAPGVDILSASEGGGYSVRSGTSMAAPFVTGAAALLMEWGIVRGNDTFLYGEKVKAYLRRGARSLPGFSEWPNAQAGWGALCVRDSLPI